MNSYSKIGLQAFLHATLGGFAEEDENYSYNTGRPPADSGANSSKSWSVRDKRILLCMAAQKKSRKAMAERLGRSVGTVTVKLSTLRKQLKEAA